MRKHIFLALTLSLLTLGNEPAFSADAQSPLSGFKESELPKEPEAQPQIEIKTETKTGIETKTDTSDTSSALPPEPEVHVKDGPLQEARKDLLRSINRAQESGTGVTNYMRAFDYIEDMAVKAQPEADIQKRIDSLKSGLDEQMKRSAQIKTEAQASAASGGSKKMGLGNLIADPFKIPENFRTMGGGAGADSKQLLDSIIADKLGGKMPSQMTKAEIYKKMKEVPELEEYLKKFVK